MLPSIALTSSTVFGVLATIVCFSYGLYVLLHRNNYSSHYAVGEHIFGALALGLAAFSIIEKSGWSQNLAVESTGALLVVLVLDRESTRRASKESAGIREAAFGLLFRPLLQHLVLLTASFMTSEQVPANVKTLVDQLRSLDPNAIFKQDQAQLTRLIKSLDSLMDSIERLMSSFSTQIEKDHIDLLVKFITLGEVLRTDLEERLTIMRQPYEYYMGMLSNLCEIYEQNASEAVQLNPSTIINALRNGEGQTKKPVTTSTDA